MSKQPKYFYMVYDDFLARVKWYYEHGLMSNVELSAIIDNMARIKNSIVIGTKSQRQGVIELANVFRDYNLK